MTPFSLVTPFRCYSRGSLSKGLPGVFEEVGNVIIYFKGIRILQGLI